MKKLLLFITILFLSSVVKAESYAICKNTQLKDFFVSLKIEKNKISINRNNKGFKDYSNYLKIITKEEILIEKNKERTSKVFACDKISSTRIEQFYPACEGHAFGKLSLEREITRLYKMYPFESKLYIKIDRVSGFMEEHFTTFRIQKDSSDEYDIRPSKNELEFICEAKSEPLF